VTVLMRDHPGWATTSAGADRVMLHDDTVWHSDWNASTASLTTTPVDTAPLPAPAVDRYTAPPTGRSALANLGPALTGLGPVLRVRNADLWDAIGTAIIRQVIRAPQAREMYARFCQAHGQSVTTSHGTRYLFPNPKVVADLPAIAFDELGMAFKRPALVAAAGAIQTRGIAWKQLAPGQLVDQLQQVHRIGPWTAGAAVADASGDFSHYPYADLAVRTWARRAAPHHDWPDTEPAFGALWRRAAGASLSAFTLLTLAWGDTHVRAP
jgi:DNA-3-methyladenine glycosylase II